MRLRRKLLIALGGIGALVVVGLVIVYPSWRRGSDEGGQKQADPFRIAGNLWYVGANDIAAFLITGPEGHILIDGGYPGTPRLIMQSIAQLGFDIRDVEILLNSEPHFDHAGGLAELQRASGAELWASAPSARVMAAGGDDPDIILPLRALFWIGLLGYDAPRVDHVFADGDTIRVGPVAVTAHVTGGHTRGCTSYAIPVQEGDRELLAVSACSLVVLGGTRYPEQPADLARTFERLRSLPADVWVTSHARLWDRYRKFVARDTAASPIAPFIDPDGYRAYIDSGEARFRRGVVQ